MLCVRVVWNNRYFHVSTTSSMSGICCSFFSLRFISNQIPESSSSNSTEDFTLSPRTSQYLRGLRIISEDFTISPRTSYYLRGPKQKIQYLRGLHIIAEDFTISPRTSHYLRGLHNIPEDFILSPRTKTKNTIYHCVN